MGSDTVLFRVAATAGPEQPANPLHSPPSSAGSVRSPPPAAELTRPAQQVSRPPQQQAARHPPAHQAGGAVRPSPPPLQAAVRPSPPPQQAAVRPPPAQQPVKNPTVNRVVKPLSARELDEKYLRMMPAHGSVVSPNIYPQICFLS